MRLNIQPEFTNHCNYQCVYCPRTSQEYQRESGFMSGELFDIVLKNAWKYARCITLGFFGEQLLHPRFSEYLERLLAGARYQVILFTNWSLVTRDHFKLFSRLSSLRISMDAADPVLYDHLCPGTPVLDVDGVESNDRLVTLADKLQAWLRGPHAPTTLIHIRTSHNRKAADGVVSRWQSLLAPQDDIIVKPVISYGGIMHDPEQGSWGCSTAKVNGRVTVAWNGDCSPCNLDVNMALASGNLLTDDADLGFLRQTSRWSDTLSHMRRRQGLCATCTDANNHAGTQRYHGTYSSGARQS